MIRPLLCGLALLGCTGDATVTPTPTPPDIPSEPDTDEPTGLADQCVLGAAIPTDPVRTTSVVNVRQQPQVQGIVHMLDIVISEDATTAVAANAKSVIVFDIQGDAASVLSTIDFPKGANKVAWIDAQTIAATSRELGFLFVLDVSDPTNVQELQRVEIANPSGVTTAGGYTYVAAHTGSLLTFNGAFELVSQIEGLGNPWQLVPTPGGLLVADNTLGIVPVDLADPEVPVLGTALATDGPAQDVVVDGGYAFAALGAAGIGIYDISAPQSPSPVAAIDTSGSAVALDVSDGLLWSANHEGVAVIDVSDPTNPVPVSSEATDEYALNVASAGTRAWITDWTNLVTLDRVPGDAPLLSIDQPNIYLNEASTEKQITLSNEGGVDLVLAGATIDIDGVTISASTDRIAPGQSATLTLTAESFAGAEGTLCVSSNDPERPVAQWPVSASSSTGSSIAVGQPAIDFVLNDLDGNSHQLSSQLGHPVVIAYFATW